MSDNTVDVLIVGAGPTGLLMACELALAGVSCAVVERDHGPSEEQKANALVGQVVRALDMRGLYERASGSSSAPHPAPGHAFAGIPFSTKAVTKNPLYHMFIPQPCLVNLLLDRASELNVRVFWDCRVDDVRVEDSEANGSGGVVVASVSTPDGLASMRSRYLVAADGGRSTIRRSLGIEFTGVTTPMVARMANVRLPADQHTGGEWHIPGVGTLTLGINRFDKGSIFFIDRPDGFPMVGPIEFGVDPIDDSIPVTIDEVRASVERIVGTAVSMEAPGQPGPYALRRLNSQNTRQARSYRVGNILLVGDAAHIHPPVGGPGLNLGLQDVLNLGWKLAAEVNGWAPAGLVDSYESERHSVGERVMMHSLAQLTLLTPGAEYTALRDLLSELLRLPAVAEHMTHLLAGSDVRYDMGDDHRLSGRFVPDFTFVDGRRVAELLHSARPVLLDLGDGRASAVGREFADRVDVVSATAVTESAQAILIRPDGYVAWATDTVDSDAENTLRAALARWFGNPAE